MTIDWVATFARDIALVVWVGGLIAIDLIETPAKFRVKEIDRNQAVALGRAVFSAMNRVEVVTGAILLGTCLWLNPWEGPVAHSSRAVLPIAGFMWLIALVQYFWLLPKMAATTKGLDLVNRDPADPRFLRLRKLHPIYAVLDLGKIGLGLLLLAFLA